MKKLEYLMSNLKENVNTNKSEIQMEIMDSPITADELPWHFVKRENW